MSDGPGTDRFELAAVGAPRADVHHPPRQDLLSDAHRFPFPVQGELEQLVESADVVRVVVGHQHPVDRPLSGVPLHGLDHLIRVGVVAQVDQHRGPVGPDHQRRFADGLTGEPDLLDHQLAGVPRPHVPAPAPAPAGQRDDGRSGKNNPGAHRLPSSR